MSTDYRHAPAAAAPDVVIYRPFGKWLPWLLSFVVVGFGLGLMSGIFSGATSTDVTCGHSDGGGSCIVTTTRPLLGESTVIVPLSSVSDAAVRSYTSNKHTVYEVVLLTDSGPVSLSLRGGERADREQVQRALHAFLVDPKHPSIKIPYDVGSRASLWFLFIELVPAFIIWLLLRRVRVVFDWEAKRLRIERGRGPFRPWVRSLPLDQVSRARLVARPGRKGGVSYSVVLDLVDGEVQPLAAGSSGSAKHHERTLLELEALLARRQSPAS